MMDRTKDWMKDEWKSAAKSMTQRRDAVAGDADAGDDNATCNLSISRARDDADDEEESITGAAAMTAAAAAAACAV
jgi:hypothetical protein